MGRSPICKIPFLETIDDKEATMSGQEATTRTVIAKHSFNNCKCGDDRSWRWKLVSVKCTSIDLGDHECDQQDVTQVVMRCTRCAGMATDRLLGKFSQADIKLPTDDEPFPSEEEIARARGHRE